MADGWTISEAVHQLEPRMPRRELARRLKDVPPSGVMHGRLGRKPKTYPIDAIMRAHAAWVREREDGTADGRIGW